MMRLASKQGEAVAASAQRLLERTIALSADECRIVTLRRQTPSRWRQDVCAAVDEARTRLYWINDTGVLFFELSASNTTTTMPPLCTHPAFAAPGVLHELAERLCSIEGLKQHDTRITIKDLTLLQGAALDEFLDVIRWMIESIADVSRKSKHRHIEAHLETH